jgi:protein gp37
MAKDSTIEWTHHTFNPWWGCTKVSPGCKHCYAEAWAKRVGQDVWGARAPRRELSEAYWRQPLAWNAKALRTGKRTRVFCASMADVFEDRRDLDARRERLWRLINDTPRLDWLLLTKRPQILASRY